MSVLRQQKLRTKTRQLRIGHYFPSYIPNNPSGRSFLDLPFSVRKLVYEYAGICGHFADLNYTNLKVYPKGEYPETQGCRKLDAEGWYELKKADVAEQDEVWEIDNDSEEDVKFYGTSVWDVPYGSHQSLLLASKQIHREVEALTYVTAVFRVCLGQPLGFTRLLRMSDNAISHLGSLTVRLDVPRDVVWSDGWENDNTTASQDWVPNKVRKIDIRSKWGKFIMKSWSSVLERLHRLIRPGQLRLCVIFGAWTAADAKAIIEPMIRLPQLKDCGICVERNGQKYGWELDPSMTHASDHQYRFCAPPDPHLRKDDTDISQLIQQVIQKLTAVQGRLNAPFRYLDLPQEIRFEILEYTDLVSSCDVQWRPRERIMEPPPCTFCEAIGYRMITDERDDLCNCDCFETIESADDYGVYICCKACGPKDGSGICYCSIQGSIRSSSCKYNAKRSALFSVSVQVRQDAIPVFYARNRILVTPYNCFFFRHRGNWNRWPIYGNPIMPKVELSLYLSSIACNALQYIRWLEWILPYPRNGMYLRPRTKAWLDYLDTILLMQHAMTLSGLTFTVNISAATINTNMWRWFETIILPMGRLGEAGLKDFFVYLPRIVETGRKEHHERDLERAVMGKGYDSAKRGKPMDRMEGFFPRSPYQG